MPPIMPSVGLNITVANTRFREPHVTTNLSLSSLNSTSHSDNQDEIAPYSRQQVYKKIHDWFAEWQPWQQRMLLCGLTNRCSTSQLESMATTLEPIFHRDFMTSLRKRYPSAPFRRQKDSIKEQTKDVKTFALELGNEIIANAMLACATLEEAEHIQNVKLNNSGNAESTEIKEESSETSVLEHKTDTLGNMQCMLPGSHLGFSSELGESTIKETEPIISRPVSELVATMSDTTKPAVEPSSMNVNQTEIGSVPMYETVDGGDVKKVEKNERNNKMNAVRTSGFPKATKSTKSTNTISTFEGPRKIYISRQLLTAFEYTPRPEPMAGSGAASFQDNLGLLLRRQHVSIVNRQHTAQSYPPAAPPSCVMARGSHRHRSGVTTADVRTVDFFNKGRSSKLGPMQAELRTGSVRRPAHVTDLSVPVQKLYKPVKFWGPNPVQGKIYIRPKKSALKWYFREQVNCIWEWMAGWKEFEKLNLLVEVVKLCDGEMLNYLTQCLIERLLERVDITWLPDQLLILIFSYLPAEDIDACSRVCRRWRYLSSCNELWMIKSQEFGLDQGISNILDLVSGAGQQEQSVDWRLAYQELQTITEQARHSLPIPSRLGFESATPVGMKRVAGKFMPASEPASTYRSESRASQFSGFSGLSKSTSYASHTVRVHRRPVLLREPEVSPESPILEQEDGDLTTGISPVMSESVMSQPRDRRMSVHREKDPEQLSELTDPLIRPVEKLHGKRRGGDDDQDVALDVRPELVQARNLLNKTVAVSPKGWSDEDAKEARERLQAYASNVEPIRRVRKLQGHMDAVLCVELDARRLVSGSLDRTVRIWDIRSGRNIQELYGHKGGITCIRYDNETLYTGSWDTSIMVWDMVKFRRISVLTGHRGSVSCLAMNDQYLLSGSHDSTVRVWCRATLVCDVVIEGHTSPVTCMKLQGAHVITGSSDRSIRIAVFLTGTCTRIINTSYPVNTLWLTGSLLLTGNQRGELHVINMSSGKPEVAISAHDGPITCVAFFSNHIFTSSRDATIKEWNLMTMMCVRSLQGHKGAVHDIKITSKSIVSVGADGHVRIWDKILPTHTSGNRQDQIQMKVVDQTNPQQ